MFKYYCAVDDAITYFTDRINNGVRLTDYVESICARHPTIEKQFRKLLRPSLELERKLNEVITEIEPDAEFFFRYDKTANGDTHRIINPAWMLLGSFAETDRRPTLESLIERLRRMPQHEMDRMFVNYLHDLEVEEATKELYCDISEENCGNLFTILRGCALEQSTRSKLIDIYANFDEYVDRLKETLEPAVDVITKNEDIYAELVLKLEELLDGCGGVAGYMKTEHNYTMKISNANHYAHILVLAPHTVSVRDGIMENNGTFIGVSIKEIIALRNSDRENLKISNMFKMLSDETRLEILQAICRREMYGLEIAEDFSISAPTVSYHLRKLNIAGFTESYFEGGKTYYRASRDGIRHFIKDIENYLSSED